MIKLKDLFAPVSSEFLDDEEIEYKRRLRLEKLKRGFKKATEVARDGLNIYYEMRDKTPVSIGLGVLSACGTISEHLSKNGEDAELLLKEMGYFCLMDEDLIFLLNLYKKMDLPSRIYWKATKYEYVVNIEEFNLEGSRIYFIVYKNNGQVVGPYVKNKEQFYIDTSKVIQEHLGQFLLLDIVANTSKERSEQLICRPSSPSSITLEAINPAQSVYVSPLDEEKLISDIKKFFQKGRNRSLLFYGVPGSGKTTMALRLTEALGGKILIINGWALSSKSVSSIYKVIKLIDPSIILFDDLDRIMDMETLLSDLERMNSDQGNSRLFIGTVNDLHKVPVALRRPGRFDQAIKFDAHKDKNVRIAILKVHAEKEDVTLSEEDFELLGTLSEGMTGAYLKEVILRVSIVGMKEIEEHIKNMKEVSSI